MTMNFLKFILVFLLGTNLTVFLCSIYYTRRYLTIQNFDAKNATYQFFNPSLAYSALQQLDTAEFKYKSDRKLGGYYLGMSGDNNYCDKHRAYFVNHPEDTFNGKNHITDILNLAFIRTQVLDKMGTNVLPKISGRYVDRYHPAPVETPLNISLFLTQNLMYKTRILMKQFSCLSQMSNHIPGHDSLARKDFTARDFKIYSRQYQSRSHCFDVDQLYPKTYLLQDREDCKEFFTVFNSPEYRRLKKERNIVYFRKVGVGVHIAEGVFPVDREEEKYLKELYDYGYLCGEIKDNNLMQLAIHNPLLLKGSKFDFRIYMLIASTNPIIAYYHDGFLRVSLHKYDPSGNSKESMTPNGHSNDLLIKLARDKGSYMGKTEDELKEDYLWSLQRFQDFLLKKGVIHDPNWLDNYLRPQFKKAMIHLIRMSQFSMLRTSSIFEFYGCDFMMDENLNIWYVEANYKPAIEGINEEYKEFFTRMYSDQFEIMFAILRSRMKRVFNYINNMIVMGEIIQMPNDVFIENLEKKKREFKELTKNRIDPEFEVSPTNRFHKIIDENEIGTKIYDNLISQECL